MLRINLFGSKGIKEIKDADKLQLPTEKTNVLDDPSPSTTYGTFSLAVSPFTEAQAKATATWWLQNLTHTVPTILTYLFFKKDSQEISLTEAQQNTFITVLSDLIYEESQKEIYQKANKYLEICFNGKHWDLVITAMSAVPFAVNNQELIQRNIESRMQPDGKAYFIVGTQRGEIYSPNNSKTHSNQDYVFRKMW